MPHPSTQSRLQTEKLWSVAKIHRRSLPPNKACAGWRGAAKSPPDSHDSPPNPQGLSASPLRNSRAAPPRPFVTQRRRYCNSPPFALPSGADSANETQRLVPQPAQCTDWPRYSFYPEQSANNQMNIGSVSAGLAAIAERNSVYASSGARMSKLKKDSSAVQHYDGGDSMRDPR